MLGAKLPEALVSGDLNTLRNGTYQTSASLTNKPEGSGSSAIIWHTTYAEGFWGIQFYLDRNAQLIYFRHFVSSGYQPWQILYGNSILTNSTLLSQLASALGDLIPKDLNASDDIENLKAGFYRLVGIKPIGFPSGVGLYGYMIIRGRGSFRQLYYSNTSGEIVTAYSFTGSSSGNIANWYKFEGTLVKG